MRPTDFFDELYNLRIHIQNIRDPLSIYLIRAIIGVLHRIEDGEETEELLNLTVSLYWTAHQFILQHLEYIYKPDYIEEARKEHEQKLAELVSGRSRNR